MFYDEDMSKITLAIVVAPLPQVGTPASVPVGASVVPLCDPPWIAAMSRMGTL
jgi:hypothetical protein